MKSEQLPSRSDKQFARDVLAAVAFLWHDTLPEDIYEQLADADDQLLATLANLVSLRVAPDA